MKTTRPSQDNLSAAICCTDESGPLGPLGQLSPLQPGFLKATGRAHCGVAVREPSFSNPSSSSSCNVRIEAPNAKA
jgi:hypothetical protein